MLKSEGGSKPYDGTPLTKPEVKIEPENGFVEGEVTEIKATGKVTLVAEGKVTNTIEYTTGEKFKESNYIITKEEGKLFITANEEEVVVTITGNSVTATYDGNEKEAKGYKVEISNPQYKETDFSFNGTAEVKEINASASPYKMGLSEEQFTNENPNFKNVRFEVTDGLLEIAKREVTFTANSASKKYDGEALTDGGYKLTSGSLAKGQKAIVTVVGSQTQVGFSENEITEVKIVTDEIITRAMGEDVTVNYEIKTINGILTVTDGTEDDPVDPDKIVTKIHDGKSYDLDETVTFTINVKNIYATTKTITITELPGVTIEGADTSAPNVLVVKDVVSGETITVKATYKITASDIANGKFVNTVRAEFSEGKSFENNDTVTVVDPVYDYTMEKAADESKHENGMFKVGETIHYTIKIMNTGNQPLNNIKVKDTLTAAGTITNISGAEYAQDGKVTTFAITNLQPKQEAVITYEYLVLDADKGNTINNAVVGPNPTDPEKPGKEDDTETIIEDPKLEVNKEVKAITAVDGTTKDITEKAALNDIITYMITVKNTGNVVLTNVNVADSLEGIQLAGDQSFELEMLAVGEEKTITYTYQVQEKDLGKTIINQATATATVPEDPEDMPKPKDEDEKEVPTEDRNPSLAVEKKVISVPTVNDKYVVGDTITYEVTVTNTGNLTLQNINVQDIMTRPDGTQIVPNGLTNQVQMIEVLEPNANKILRYTHVVTEQDLGGELRNVVTVSGDPVIPNQDPEKPEENPKAEDNESVITEDPANCSIIVTKKLTSMKDEALVLDDAVFYVSLFTDEALTKQIGEVQKLTFGANQSTATATFSKIKRGIYYVAETDADGKVLINGVYNDGTFVAHYTSGQQVEIKENGATVEFAFANQFKTLPREYYLSKSVTITKSVQTKKGEALKTDETFYAGIFSDAAHTKLAENVDQNIVPLATNGTAGAENSIEVTFAPDDSVTLYIAEVSADGVPVEQNVAFEYIADIDQNQITLSESTDDITVKITNTSKKDEPENKTGSKKQKVSTKGVKTGDDTPIMTLAILLLCSAACILILVFRRRKGETHKNR